MWQILLQNNDSCFTTKCKSYFITKCYKSLLQNTLGFLLQNATDVLQTATVITKCDSFLSNCNSYYKCYVYYKMRPHNVFSNKKNLYIIISHISLINPFSGTAILAISYKVSMIITRNIKYFGGKSWILFDRFYREKIHFRP